MECVDDSRQGASPDEPWSVQSAIAELELGLKLAKDQVGLTDRDTDTYAHRLAVSDPLREPVIR